MSSGSGSSSQSSTGQQGTTELAKDQAGQVKQGAATAASQVTSTGKDQAVQVAQEAKSQASGLAGQVRGQVSQQTNAQRDKLVTTLRSFGDEIEQMLSGGGAPQSGIVADLTRQAQTKVQDLAGFFENREPADILDDVRSFARRRPGAFLLGSAVAGVLAGRMTKGAVAAKKDSSDDNGYSSYQGQASYQGQSAYQGSTMPVPSTTTTAANTGGYAAAPYTDPSIDLTDSSSTHGVSAEGYRDPTTGPLAPGGTGYGDEERYPSGTSGRTESGSGWSS
jgi:hypothetical protein